jgi:hypothetical protein
MHSLLFRIVLVDCVSVDHIFINANAIEKQIEGRHRDEICNAEPILEELVRMGRIRISGEMVTLILYEK